MVLSALHATTASGVGGRVLVSAVLVVAGVAKAVDRAGSRDMFAELGLPPAPARAGAVLLPALEVVLAAALVPAGTARAAALAAAALFALFTVVPLVALVRGQTIDCNCFGALHSGRLGPATIARNALLIAAAAAAAAWGGGSVADLDGTAVAALAAGLVVAAQVAFAVQVLRQNGRVLARLAALEAELQREPLAGEVAPALELRRLDGGNATLAGLLDRGRPVLLAFTDPGCGPCRALLPALAEWQTDLADEITVVPVARSLASTAAPVYGEHELEDVLLDPDSAVADAYGVSGVPTAVLVDSDGRLAAAPALGARDIESLVRDVPFTTEIRS